MSNLQYQLQPSEAGVFVEIYLPKRAHYQGVLYKALTEGFDIEKVKAHFLSNRESIEKYIEKAKTYLDVSENGRLSDNFYLSESIINRLPDLYYGYSMYEVDGVFRSRALSEKTEVIEERTQIIRLMFKLDLERQLQGLSTNA